MKTLHKLTWYGVLAAAAALGAADRQTVRAIARSPYNENLFRRTYASLTNRVEWDGYARTALEASYPNMYLRDSANQAMAHIAMGDLEYARDILGYLVRFHRVKNAARGLHHIPKVDYRDDEWPYGAPLNVSVYSQPLSSDTVARVDGPRYRVAQRFVPVQSGRLQGIEAAFSMAYAAPGTIMATIRTALDGPVVASASVSTQRLERLKMYTPAGPGWVRFDILPPVQLTAGTTYYIQVSADVRAPIVWRGRATSQTTWGPSYAYDADAGGWSGPRTSPVCAYVMDDYEGRWRIYPNPSIADEADATYIFVKAWTEYILASGDHAFRDYSYDVITRIADNWMQTEYNATFKLIRNPWLEAPLVYSDVYDIFTNAYAAQGFKELARIAQDMGRSQDAAKWHGYYVTLSSGINTTLARPSGYNGQPTYFMWLSVDENNKPYEGFSCWSLGPIPPRWDQLDPVRFRNMYDLARTHGSFLWRGLRGDVGKDYRMLAHVSTQVPRPPQDYAEVMVRTESYAWEMLYCGIIGDWDRLVELYRFMEDYNRDPNGSEPIDLIPEAMGWQQYSENRTWAWNRGNQIMAANYVFSIRRLRDILFPPVRLRNIPGTVHLPADGVSETTITVQVVNEFDEVVYDSTHTLTFLVSGPGTIVGEPSAVVRNGSASIRVRAGTNTGLMTVFSFATGLTGGTCEINVQQPSVPSRLEMAAAPSRVRADGRSVSTVTVRILDEQDQVVANATHTVTFQVVGNGVLLGGSAVPAVNGVAVAHVLASTVPGQVTVTASAAGLPAVSTVIIAEACGALRFGLNPGAHVAVPASPNLSVSGTGFTVEAWVRNLSPGDWNGYPIVRSGNNTFNLWTYGFPELHFSLNVGGTERDLQVNLDSKRDPVGEWHHLAGTYDGSTIRLYYNGTCMRSMQASGTINLSNTPVYIGGAPGQSSFTGIVDEVRISTFCRYPGNFIVPRRAFEPDGGTVGLWHFDESSPTMVVDAGPRGNHGTFVNNPIRVIGYPFDVTSDTGTAPGPSGFILTTTVVPSTAGSVLVSPPGMVYATGTAVTLTAVPINTATVFVGWTGDVPTGVSSTTNPLTVIMDRHRTLNAHFRYEAPPPNQPPTVTMTSPVNGSTYTAPATLNLAATATDPDGTIANVRFYRGTTLLATDTASPYEYTWADVSSGTYQLRAVAQDNQGATSTSTVVTVTVLSSSTPPVWYTLTTAVHPPNSGSVNPASGTFLAGSQIQVTATPNAGYTFATWSGDITGTNPTVTLTMDGNKTLTANFTYTPLVNSSPSVAIISPADGATYSAPADITIRATATDTDGTITVVRFYHGTFLLNTDSASPYEYTWTGVPAGSYILTAQAEDDQGAVGTSAAVGITVSAQPVYYTLTVNVNPTSGGTVALNPPPTGSGYLAGTTVTVTATPNAGYEFVEWNGAVTSSATSITVTMDGNKTLGANFRATGPALEAGEVRIIGGPDGYINATVNPNVTIRFRRTAAGKVTVRIYDLRGRLVMEKTKDGPAGIDDDIAWNAAEVPTGVYLARVNGGGVETSKRVVIVR